jgi:cell wall-associated NlpC family hydrolase
MSEVSRDVWVRTCLRFEGTPFVHQGRLPGVGMDCPAWMIVGAWECGTKPRSFDVQGYPRTPDGHTLQRLCDEHLVRLPSLVDALPGDAILTAFRESGRAQHLGMLVDATPGRMYWMQAEGYRAKATRVTRLALGGRFLQFVAAYRVPGVACS